ncbi:MAG: hypothetical protein MRY74_04140 [Neomegalonema sp.]|nr:hypothetical protein [Neomegalonema sp.]
MENNDPPPLPIGATGFFHVSSPHSHEGYGRSDQLRYVHVVAQQLRARVSGEIAIEPRGSIVSFRRFELICLLSRGALESACKTAIALHSSAPVAAFMAATDQDPELGATRFEDPPAGLDLTTPTGPWIIWRKRWLDAPVRAESIAHLPEWERNQIGYSKPLRLGDLLFNKWD